MKIVNFLEENKIFVPILFVLFFVVFCLGRISLYLKLNSYREPPRVVSDVSALIPVFEVFSKPDGLIEGKINFPEARIVYKDKFWETEADGSFKIE